MERQDIGYSAKRLGKKDFYHSLKMVAGLLTKALSLRPNRPFNGRTPKDGKGKAMSGKSKREGKPFKPFGKCNEDKEQPTGAKQEEHENYTFKGEAGKGPEQKAKGQRERTTSTCRDPRSEQPAGWRIFKWVD